MQAAVDERVDISLGTWLVCLSNLSINFLVRPNDSCVLLALFRDRTSEVSACNLSACNLSADSTSSLRSSRVEATNLESREFGREFRA